MYTLGHIGLTVAAFRAWDRRADLGLPALLSMAPDIVDKPVEWLFAAAVHHNTRSVGHTLFGALVVLALLLSGRRTSGRPWALWACYLGHLLLDLMWEARNPLVLFWPLAGPFPPPSSSARLQEDLFRYNVAGEALGAGLLLALAGPRLMAGWRRPSGAAGGGG